MADRHNYRASRARALVRAAIAWPKAAQYRFNERAG
jgi:hypothetical protein